MTTGRIVRETTMNSGGRNDPRDVTNAEAQVDAKLNLLRKPGNRPEDRLNEKIIDEDFRRKVERIFKGISDLPYNWNDMTVREQRDWVGAVMRRHYINTPDSLLPLCVGSLVRGDCERSDSDPKPDWLDHEKLLRGQRFALKHLSGIFFAQLVVIYSIFSFENATKPMVVTNKSSDPFSSFKRYLSTSCRTISWYESDPFTKGTKAYKELQGVRKLHAAVRDKLEKWSFDEIHEASQIKDAWNPTRKTLIEDFRDSCPIPLPGQCPYVFSEQEKYKYSKGLDQGDMAGTLFGFVSFTILYPEYFGIHGATDEELHDFCHLWRCLAYLLGVEDEFNVCRGSLEDVRQRSRDFFEYWAKPNFRDVKPEWEHLLRCMTEGINYYFPINYEHSLLYVMDLLEIPVPRFRASLSYISRIHYLTMKYTFYWTARLPGVMKIMNYTLRRALQRARNFTDDELKVLQEKSKYTMSKVIAESMAICDTNESGASSYWQKVFFLVVLSSCFLMNLPIVAKEFAKTLFRIDFGATMNH